MKLVINMNVSYELKLIREITGLSQEELGKRLGVSRLTIINWEQNKVQIEETSVERIYEFAFKNHIFLNKLFEMNYIEANQSDNNVIVFHGAKKKIIGDLDFNHSKKDNDFGKGVYFGENLDQAGSFISSYEGSHIYVYSFNTLGLKGLRFKVSPEWMLTVAYYRGLINDYSDNKLVIDLVKKIEECDYIIAPIADNKMYDIISEYVNGMITDKQCSHALSATDLDNQYVIKSSKALKQLYLLRECYISESERNEYDHFKRMISDLGASKVRMALIEYKNQGKYIDEVLNERTK